MLRIYLIHYLNDGFQTKFKPCILQIYLRRLFQDKFETALFLYLKKNQSDLIRHPIYFK